MKKLVLVLIILCLGLAMTGCGADNSEDDGVIRFYYLRNDILYGAEDGVIASENRYLYNSSMEHLLNVYLAGPETQTLHSPFPDGIRILSVSQDNEILYLKFSSEFTNLDSMDQVLACGCICHNLFPLTEANEIHISGENSTKIHIFTRDSFTLSDESDVIHSSIGTESDQ